MLHAWRLRLGRFFGIDVFVHLTFFLLPLLVLLQTPDEDPLGYGPLLGLGLLLAAFGCVLLHEFGHALTARRFGIGTRDITLYPIGGVARLERMTENPWEEFWIAIAGPAVNVAIVMVLAFIGAIVVFCFGPAALSWNSMIGVFYWLLIFVNLMLVGFNMLPAFPMDGGRVFRAILTMWLGHLRATQIASTVGAIMAGLMILVGLFLWPSVLLVIVGIFVFIVGQLERIAVQWRHRMRYEEPLDVIPVYNHSYLYTPEDPATAQSATSNGFPFGPKITVYTWDGQQGVWIKES